MPGKTQNPDSWFYRARVRAGFPNAALLAQRLGVPKGTVYNWERGSAEPHPSHRPPWWLMPKIAEALGVPVNELVEKLWKEKIGDPCPCGCSGVKIAPDGFPQARELAIELPCGKCPRKRIYRHRKKGRHRKLCPTCASTAERMKFTCVGYRDHNATRYAAPCPRIAMLRPFEVNARQLLKDNGLNSRFDAMSRTYQCTFCAGAERLIADREGCLGAPIRSRTQRLRLLRDHHRTICPNFKATPEDREKGRRNFAAAARAGKKFPKMTEANQKVVPGGR